MVLFSRMGKKSKKRGRKVCFWPDEALSLNDDKGEILKIL